MCNGCAKVTAISPREENQAYEGIRDWQFGPKGSTSHHESRIPVLYNIQLPVLQVVLCNIPEEQVTRKCVERFIADCKAETKQRLNMLLTDNGGEYINKPISNFLLTKSIKHQRTVPYSPQQNGTAER